MREMVYENFVNGAFDTCCKGGDPAGLADADFYCDDCILEVKVAVAYSIKAYAKGKNNEIEVVANEFFHEVMKANALEDISILIDNFKRTTGAH